MTIDLSSFTLDKILAHREPMILITRVKDFTQSELVAEVEINNDTMFYSKEIDGVPSWVGVEYMAQSIAAFAGLESLSRQEDIKIGFLLGSRKFKNYIKCFPNGALLEIRVVPLYREASGLGQFQCQLYCNKVLANEANINTFSPPNPQEFIRGSSSE